MPFQSQAQAGWAFATGQPFAKRWARQTGPYKRLPYKKRHKATPPTLADLEAYVSSPTYTPEGAQALAAQIPMLREKATGAPGELISPGVRRIHGNLCNVHGRYGPCDKALSGKKPAKARKPRAPIKPKLTPAERVQARDAAHAQNQAATLAKLNISPAGQAALQALRRGEQADPKTIAAGGFEQAGLVSRADDGSYHLTPSGRAALSAAASGDVGRTGDTISGARDRANARQTRQQAAQARTQAATLRKQQTQAARSARLAKQGKKPTAPTTAPRRVAKPKRRPMPRIGASPSASAPKPPAKAPAPAPKVDPAITEARNLTSVADAIELGDNLANLNQFSAGKPLRDQDVTYLVSQGLLERASDGTPRQTAQGKVLLNAAKRGDTQDAKDALSRARDGVKTKSSGEPDQSQFAGHTMEDWDDGLDVKKPSHDAVERARTQFAQALGLETVAQPPKATAPFTVFKDAHGQYRWVAFSSTAYRDRDGEIVSTKALADDCARADQDGHYGVLDWWHMPSIVLGDCDFNAMHGRVLIESGTFRSHAIAEKVAQAAPDLELSIAFLHPHTEPDPHGVFDSIRRFARALTPRGRASNLFTSFHVKESPMDETKKAGLKLLGFSDAEIGDLETRAAQTQKAADASGVAFKAEEPDVTEPPDLVINGVTYKAFPPKVAADAAPTEGSPAEEAAETPAEEAAEPDAGMDDAGGLTLSPEDIDAIGQAVGGAITQAIAPLMGLLDIEKKMQGHVQTMMQPFQQAQTTKDASDAEKAEQITALQTSLKATQDKLDELLGLQPAVPATRPSETQIMNPWNPQDVALIESVKNQLTPQQQQPSGFSDLTQNLFGTLPPAQS